MANERDDRTLDVEMALSRLLACPDPDPAFLSRLEARLTEREAAAGRRPRSSASLTADIWHRLSEWVGAAAAAPGRLATGLLWAATVVALVAVLWARAASLRQVPGVVSATARPTVSSGTMETSGASPLPQASGVAPQFVSPLASPTATALPSERNFGHFPRTAFIARAPGTSYLAVYLAEGNSVTQVRALGRTNWGSTSHSSELSPDGRHLATRFVDGELGGTYIQVFDLETGDQQLVADSAIRMRPVTADEPRGYEEITSVAWLDDEHVLYTRVFWLHAASVTGEVWVSDLRGENQSLLGAGSIYRVVGASPDGKAIYVTRLIPGMWDWQEEGLALLELTSGEVRNLWPAEDVGSEVHHAFGLVSLPDGSRRISFVTMQRAMTMVTEPPRIWLGDPQTGEAELVWTVTESLSRNGYSIYNIPAQIAWSPGSPHRFAYLEGCGALGGLWLVDADTSESMLLAEADPPDCHSLSLLSWAAEGIVVLEDGVLRLLSEAGEELGRLTLASATSLPE
jgi:hypothetical protein